MQVIWEKVFNNFNFIMLITFFSKTLARMKILTYLCAVVDEIRPRYSINRLKRIVMTNKEMLIKGVEIIAVAHNVVAEFYFDDEMVTLSGNITAEVASKARELCNDLCLIDKDRECKCLVADCGIDIVFDECWERRVGNKEFKGNVPHWMREVA